MAEACHRCGRDSSAVRLVCVTKGVPAERVQVVIELGERELGESRVQESRAKQIALGSRLEAQGSDPQPSASNLQPIRWHLIGHLQRNKVREAVGRFDMIHSVDSPALIDELERRAGESSKRITEALIQVNVSGESTKHGCRPNEALGLAESVRRCAHLTLSGFMTIAPFSEKPEQTRPYFRALRKLRDRSAESLNLESATLNLSMGMSNDFEVAIEEGATLVRIGTAIFGAREMRQET